MDLFKEEQLSDDEVFTGKFSLKEVKKRVLWNKQHAMYHKPENVDRSVKIIETHSAPDIQHMDSKLQTAPQQLKALSNPVLSPFASPYPRWDIKNSDDSFLKIEKMVTDLSLSNQQESSVALDNTLDVIDYILKNGPSQMYENPNLNTNNNKEIPEGKTFTEINSVTKVQEPTKHPTCKDNQKDYKTPLKTCKKTEAATPYTNVNSDFKTPGIPASSKKTPHSLLKKTLTKTNNYKHVASPVALYINKSPAVPLIRRPAKILPGHSSIPIFMKSTQCKPSNKENINLPTVAYKNAKKTEVINISDDEKLPQSQWAHKMASSLPRPLVMKHEHREMKIAKKLFMSKADKSYADLSLQQADVSVCIQKSAFNHPKKN